MCAVIQRGILGGFKNKIGNVVGTSWKGIAVMKALPLSVANPRTAGQVTQRSKFGYASQFAALLLATLIKPLWDRFAQKQSGYNAFIQTNIDALDAGGTVDFASLKMSKGKLDTDQQIGAVADDSANTVIVTRTSIAGTGNALSTDKVYMTLLSSDLSTILVRQEVTRGAAGVRTDTYSIGGLVTGQLIWLYYSYLRADGSMASDSIAFSTTVVA